MSDHLAECFAALKDAKSITPGSAEDRRLQNELWERAHYGRGDRSRHTHRQHPLYLELLALRLANQYPGVFSGESDSNKEIEQRINSNLGKALCDWNADYFEELSRTMKAIEKAERQPEEPSRIDRFVLLGFLSFYGREKRLPNVVEWKDETDKQMEREGVYLDKKEWDRARKLFSMNALNPGPERRGRRPERCGEPLEVARLPKRGTRHPKE